MQYKACLHAQASADHQCGSSVSALLLSGCPDNHRCEWRCESGGKEAFRVGGSEESVGKRHGKGRRGVEPSSAVSRTSVQSLPALYMGS